MPLNGIEGIFFVSMTCGANGIQGIGSLLNFLEDKENQCFHLLFNYPKTLGGIANCKSDL